MSHRSKHNKPYQQPITTVSPARHQPTSDTSGVTLIQRGPDRYEAILCRRNHCLRFYAESADVAEQRAISASSYNFRNFNPMEKDYE